MSNNPHYGNGYFGIQQPLGNPILPFANSALEWWDAKATYITTSTGNSVSNWIGRLSGNNLIASGGSYPSLYNIEGTNYVHFGQSYMEIPSTLKWDRQNSCLFAVIAAYQSSNSRNIWSMDKNSSTDATYIVGQELRLFNSGSTNQTAIFESQNLAIIYRNSSGNGGVIMGSNNQKATVIANASGIVSGGWVGVGNNLSNPLDNCDILGIIPYNRTLTGNEPNVVFDFLANYYKATPRTDTKNLIFCGDSITYGIGSSLPDYYSYPAQLSRIPSHQPKYINLGIGGSVISSGAGNYIGNSGVNLFISQNSGQSLNTVVMLIGSNDINNSIPYNMITGSYYYWITGIRNIHPSTKIVGCTVLNRQGWDTGQITTQNALNNWIKYTGNFDYTIDTQNIPQLFDPNNTNIFVDGTHPTNLGYFFVSHGIAPILIASGAILS